MLEFLDRLAVNVSSGALSCALAAEPNFTWVGASCSAMLFWF